MRIAVLLIALIALLACATGRAQAPLDPATMQPPEIEGLQRRLTDAKCFAGVIDGRPSDALTKAIDACPDQRPILRIETGMHVAPIRPVSVNTACTLAATASKDKTVRLWSLPDGRPLRVFRTPIDSDNGGKVIGVALSPDGRVVAVGGSDARFTRDHTHAVYVFDSTTGALITRVGAFEQAINQLVFSSDGRWLAATAAGSGVQIIATATWQVAKSDTAYRAEIYGAAFAPDGRFYTTSYDGKLRRYGPGPSFPKEAEVATRNGTRPFGIAVDPAGQRIIVGYADTPAIDIYNAPSLTWRSAADSTGVRGSLAGVAWRRDGARFVAGGTYATGPTNVSPVLVFSRDGARMSDQPPGLAHGTILDLKACGGGFAAAAGDPAFGLLDGEARSQFWKTGVAADMRDKLGQALQVSGDGRRVRFGLGRGEAEAVTFDLTGAMLEATSVPTDLAPARIDGLPIVDWHLLNPTFDGKPIEHEPFDSSHALAVRADTQGFVLGTNFNLRAFDAAGQQRWAKAGPSVSWGVNLAKNGDLIVAAYGDGTIRWHRWSDGTELLALFVNKDTRQWVAWTPTGYYKASAGGEDMIGWHVNRGWEQAADFFPASKFRDTYARSDVVDRVLETLDEAEAIRQANAARPDRKVAKAITDILPPIITIASPSEGAIINSDEVTVEYFVRSPSGLPVDAVGALVDGRPANRDRGLARSDGAISTLRDCLTKARGLARSDDTGNGCRGTIVVRLTPGASEIGLFARADDRVGDVVKIRLVRAAGATSAPKAKLFALVVGISNYANRDYALAFAAKDARDFSATLANQKGGYYDDVSVRMLTDGDASAVGVRRGLDWLTKQVTERDVGVVYLAGHGVVDDRDRFYFVASDSNVDDIRATGVPREDIQDALDALPGKALLFLDACHAGAVGASNVRRGGALDINGVANEFTRTERGVVMFTASTGKQVSQESSAWGNGAFTKAVIEALGAPGQKGKADMLGKGTISASALDAYVSARVKDLTNGQQSPVMIRPSTVPDFTLAAVR